MKTKTKNQHKNMSLEKYRQRYGAAADYIITFKKKFGASKLPWNTVYNNVRSRCAKPGTKGYSAYGGRGIKTHLSPSDIKYIWLRDKAYQMTQASIDRINPNENYELTNVRFIEMRDNRLGAWFESPIRKSQYESLKNIITVTISKLQWHPAVSRAALRKIATMEYGAKDPQKA